MHSATIKRVLERTGVRHLFHANTVTTATTFLESGGLLSRGAVERRGLSQTDQASDALDKRFDIFDDIFLDTVDIHEQAGRRNAYGPVLFVYSIDVLDDLSETDIVVTKVNPVRWPDTIKEERVFLDEDDLERDFSWNDFGQCLMIKHRLSPLGFDHLEKVILDSPGDTYKQLVDEAYSHLYPLVKEYAPSSRLVFRNHWPDRRRGAERECGCMSDDPVLPVLGYPSLGEDERLKLFGF